MNRLTQWWADQSRDELWDMLRMWPTLVLAGVTVGMVHWLAPQQVGILVYTIAKLSLAGYLGYWLDRWIFPDARPGDVRHTRAHAQVSAIAAMAKADAVSNADKKVATEVGTDAIARMDWLTAVAQCRRAAVVIGVVVSAGIMS